MASEMNEINSISHRPQVMITTYYECNSKFRRSAAKRDPNNNNNNNKQSEDEQDKETRISPTAKECENSTNFFINNLRRAHGRGRVLSKVIFSQIRGPTGSVRGHKDVVRKSLEGIKVSYSGTGGAGSGAALATMRLANQSWQSFPMVSSFGASNQLCSFYGQKNRDLSNLSQLDELYCQEYLAQLCDDEQDCCVAYTTSLGVIRRTFEDSKLLRSILNLNLIKYEERDIYLNQDYRNQLRLRLNSFQVPAIFVDGQHVGGVQELELMNENGELQKRLAKFKMSSASRELCLCCGNARFIACPSCNGSRKSAIHHFKFNSVALRCIKCDKNDGLVQCPACRLSATTSTAPSALTSGTSAGTTRPTNETVGRNNTTAATIKEVPDENNNMAEENVHVLGGDQTDRLHSSSC